MWLFNVSWLMTEYCTASVQAAHMNWSSFHIYLKHEINMTEHHNVFYFNSGKTSIHNFSSLNPPKLIYSPVWFVCKERWRIRRYDWSDRLSIKLFANGQLGISCESQKISTHRFSNGFKKNFFMWICGIDQQKAAWF